MKSNVSPYVLLSTCCVAALLASPASAQVTVETTSTDPLVTSTSGDITITGDGSLEVEGDDPLTLDSDNTITVDEDGVVLADDADGRNGVVIASGTDGTFTNNGVIGVIEDFVPDDADNNSTPDGPLAQAQSRTGILVNSVDGSIENTGTVYVEGLNSSVITFADGWAGEFDNSGSLQVIGDGSVAVSTGDIATDFSLGGTVASTGEGSQVLLVDGDIDGALVIDGSLTKSRSYTNDDGSTYILSRSQLRDDVAAVEVTGSVSGGILIDARPYELDADVDDEDGDGVADDEEPTGAISSFGESPALLIGSADDIVIGSTATRDGVYSLGVDGSITASGFYSTFDATAVIIGGQGGSVTLNDGIAVGGSISAVTPDSNAMALLINDDVTVPNLFVSGSITATITSQGEGSAVAVRDLSGTLNLIENTGAIQVFGASEDETVALDLSNNTSGVTINQFLNDFDAASFATELEDEDYDPDNPTIYTSIVGDILTGTGNDSLTVSSGVVSGDTYLGAGDDTVSLSGNSAYFGTIFSEGGDFSLSLSDTATFAGILDAASTAAVLNLNDDTVFSGVTENAELLAVTVNGGLLQAPDGEMVSFGTLDVAADGSIGVVINTEDGTNSSFNVGTATFESGAKVNVLIDNVVGADGTYLVLEADNLTGQDGLELSTDILPLIYSAALSSTDDTVSVAIARKTAEELGLSTIQSAAYESIIQTVSEDEFLEASILQAEDVETLGSQFNQLLPEYDGGVLDFIARSSRLATRRLADGNGHFAEWPVGVWIEPFLLRGSKDGGDTDGYSMSGFGVSGGWERRLGDHYVGLSGSWTSGSVDASEYRSIDISKYEIGAHARLRFDNLYLFARAGYFHTSMDLESSFTGTIGDTEFTYSSVGDWNGSGYLGAIGGSYDLAVSNQLTLRPKIVAEHYSLSEDGYVTEADSDAIALTVDSRSSDLTTVTPSLVASYQLGKGPKRENPFTVEFEAGYRSVAGGDTGSITVAFDDSDAFTLSPSEFENGWTAEARVKGGGWDHGWQLGFGAEQAGGDIDLSVRALLNIAF